MTERSLLADQQMTGYQVGVVVVCLLINIIDGFDVLAISFAAPQIADEWSLAPEELGLLFSAGLAGMVLASIFVAPIADHIGRRLTVLPCLAITSFGMFGCAFADDLMSLVVLRFVVGLGVGTILPSLNTIAAEFSSTKRRELSVTIMQAGFPAGATLGGIMAVLLVSRFGWQSIFLVGGCLSLVMFFLAFWRLPESLDYLLARRPKNALVKVNDVLFRLGHASLDQLPPAESPSNPVGMNRVMSGPETIRVIFLSSAFFFAMASFYFVASWTPKLLVDAGLELTEGISGGIWLNIGGVVGGILLGALAARFGVRQLTGLYMLGAAVMMVVFSTVEGLALMMTTSFVMGYFLLGSMMGLYALTPALFSPGSRTTGTGVAVGVGRFGGILGPLATGYLLGTQWPANEIFVVFALPMVASAIMIYWLHRQVGQNLH